MTQEEFKNKKWKVGQKVYIIYVDSDKTGKRRYFLREDTVAELYLIVNKHGVIVDSICIEAEHSIRVFFSRGCNHNEYIFTRKRDAEKALRKFKKKYENGL